MRYGCLGLLSLCLLSAFSAGSEENSLPLNFGLKPIELSEWEAIKPKNENFTELKTTYNDDFIKTRARCRKVEYDYIIVGNGTAGAVLARKLSDNFRNRVLVLEAGENHSDDPVVLNPNPFAVLNEITYSPKFSFTFPAPFNDSLSPIYVYTTGRGWGGSSAHNYLLAVRGTPNVYNFWALVSGSARWAYNNVLPLMLGLETYYPNGTIPNLAQRGTTGPLDITQTPPINQTAFALAESIVTNAPLVADYNDPTQGITGISAGQVFVDPLPEPHRSFSINAFLPVGEVVSPDGRGLNGRRLRIVSNATVARVLFDNKKAVGVEYILSNSETNEVIQVFCKKKVILSAGAIHTPAILQRSGIGDPELLASLDIPVVVANPNVGTLIDHYGPAGLIATSVPGPIVGFINGSPYFPNDNIRRFETVANVAGPNVTQMFAWILEPRSRGSVHIVTRDATTNPKLDFNFYTDGPPNEFGTDAYKAVSFYKILKLIAFQLGTDVIFPPPENYPAPFGPAPDDSLLLTDAISQRGMILAAHAMNTARMGRSIAEGAVVDEFLNVIDVENLIVADASVMPTQDGNTAYPVYVIGLVAAEIIKEGNKQSRHHRCPRRR